MNEQQFDNFVEMYEEQIRLSAERANISVEAIKDRLRVIYVVVEDFVDKVTIIINNIVEFITSLDLEKMEREINQKQQLYKLDLKRPIIRSQVIDRKPQHLIKKIIY